MANVIAFKDRGSTDFLNKKILEMLRESPEYDVELVAANSKIVRAHRVVLSMYSQYFRKCLAQSAPDTKLIVPLTAFPIIALEKVVELFYCGEIRLITPHKTQVMKALAFLEVSSLALPQVKPRETVNKDSDSKEIALLKITPSEKLPQPQQKPDLKQSHPDLLRQQNSDSVSSKDRTPTEEGKEKQEKSNSATEVVTEDGKGANKPKQQQLNNETLPNALASNDTDSTLTSLLDDNTSKEETFGVSLLYDDIGGEVDGACKSAKDLLEDINIEELLEFDALINAKDNESKGGEIESE